MSTPPQAPGPDQHAAADPADAGRPARGPRFNVSFALLDRAVVAGRADEPVLPGWSHARLLEEVGALGGVLHHLGVGVGVGVRIDLDAEADAVVAALATARLGGVIHAGHGAGGPDGTVAPAAPVAPAAQVGPVGPVVVASEGSPWLAGADRSGEPGEPGVVRLVRHADPRTAPGVPGAPGGGRAQAPAPDQSHDPFRAEDLSWDAMVRAGRTDPAACTLVDAASAYAPGRSVGEVLADLQASPPPYAEGELRRILGV